MKKETHESIENEESNSPIKDQDFACSENIDDIQFDRFTGQ